jgi:hypothetical protein
MSFKDNAAQFTNNKVFKYFVSLVTANDVISILGMISAKLFAKNESIDQFVFAGMLAETNVLQDSHVCYSSARVLARFGYCSGKMSTQFPDANFTVMKISCTFLD